MNRRNALRTLGSTAICSFAGCFSTEDSQSTPPPPLEEIILYSILEAGELVSARITVEKDGSQILDIVHDFEGDERFHLAKDWMGDAVPYSVTIELMAPEVAETFSSSDFSEPDPNDCWNVWGDIYSSSMMVEEHIGEEFC